MDSISQKIQALLTSASKEHQALGWLLDKTQNEGKVKKALELEHASLLNSTSGWTLETLLAANQVVCNNKTATEFHIKNLFAARSFSCQGHPQIQTFHIANCPQLEYLHCSNNQILKKLIIENCPRLLYINCEKNQLDSLSITNAPKLIHLYATINQLKTFDLSPFPNLFVAEFSQNPIETLKLSATQYDHLNPTVEDFTKILI